MIKGQGRPIVLKGHFIDNWIACGDVMNIPPGDILHILSSLRQLCEGAFCLVKIPVLILEVQYLSIIAK